MKLKIVSSSMAIIGAALMLTACVPEVPTVPTVPTTAAPITTTTIPQQIQDFSQAGINCGRQRTNSDLTAENDSSHFTLSIYQGKISVYLKSPLKAVYNQSGVDNSSIVKLRTAKASSSTSNIDPLDLIGVIFEVNEPSVAAQHVKYKINGYFTASGFASSTPGSISYSGILDSVQVQRLDDDLVNSVFVSAGTRVNKAAGSDYGFVSILSRDQANFNRSLFGGINGTVNGFTPLNTYNYGDTSSTLPVGLGFQMRANEVFQTFTQQKVRYSLSEVLGWNLGCTAFAEINVK